MEYTVNIAEKVTVEPNEQVTGYIVAGLPPGVGLTQGSDNGNGTWTLSVRDAARVGFKGIRECPAAFRMTIATVSTNQWALSMNSFLVDVASDDELVGVT